MRACIFDLGCAQRASTTLAFDDDYALLRPKLRDEINSECLGFTFRKVEILLALREFAKINRDTALLLYVFSNVSFCQQMRLEQHYLVQLCLVGFRWHKSIDQNNVW